MSDNWKHRSKGMVCRTCISFVPKAVEAREADMYPAKSADRDAPPPVLGRCRKHAPTMGGFPVVFETDWCGDHRLDEEKFP